MKRGVPTCEWDLPPDFYWWLSLRLAQLVIKDKYMYNKVISGRDYDVTYYHHSRTLYVVHITSHT
jgi:hypothetical protein